MLTLYEHDRMGTMYLLSQYLPWMAPAKISPRKSRSGGRTLFKLVTQGKRCRKVGSICFYRFAIYFFVFEIWILHVGMLVVSNTCSVLQMQMSNFT